MLEPRQFFRVKSAWLWLAGACIAAACSVVPAQAQDVDRYVIGIEVEGEDGALEFFVGTPVGPNTALFIVPAGSTTLGDADQQADLVLENNVRVRSVINDERPFATSTGSGSIQLLLTTLGIEDGVTLEQAPQPAEIVATGDPVTTYTMRLDDVRSARVTSSRQQVEGETGNYRLSSFSSINATGRFSSGAIAFDVCGSLVGFTPYGATGPGGLFPVTVLENFIGTNPPAVAFQDAPTCTENTGENREFVRQQFTIAALEAELEAEREADREQQRKEQQEAERIAALEAQNASAEEIAAAREDLRLLQEEGAARSGRFDQITTELGAANEALENLITQGGQTQNDLRIRTYILIGVGVLALLALASLIFFLIRSRRLRSDLTAAENEKRDIADAKEAAEASWHDCILENDQGLTVKLPGASLPKSKGGVTIGRSREDADVVIDREDVSRSHARFTAEGESVEIIDLGATNRTRVNGGVLDQGVPRKLYEGDRITFGTNEFVFRISRRR